MNIAMNPLRFADLLGKSLGWAVISLMGVAVNNYPSSSF
jgi:hypothetical protein